MGRSPLLNGVLQGAGNVLLSDDFGETSADVFAPQNLNSFMRTENSDYT